MKKLFIAAAAVFCFANANAQDDSSKGFSSGDTFISGSLSYSNQKTGDLKNNQFTVSPRAGYFLTNNIAIGASLGYTTSKEEALFDFGTNETATNTFNAGVFGRYYFRPGSTFSVFTELGAGYSTLKTKVNGEDTDYKVNGFDIAFAPGFNYFVSDHFVLEATFGILGYTTVKPDYGDNLPDADSTDSFRFGLDMSNISFGLMYKF